jgi:hypothetical protein
MYYIQKYADCWAIFNDDNGNNRKLTANEQQIVIKKYPTILESNTKRIFFDQPIEGINADNLSNNTIEN